MRSSSTHSVSGPEFLRSLAATACALAAVVIAIDILLATQPALLQELSAALRTTLSVRTTALPTDVLAGALTVTAVVITSAVLLAFSRAVQRAPAWSFGPSWVALCMLAAARADVSLFLPLGTPEFAALCALSLVGGGVALRTRSTAGTALGWFAVLLPLAVVGAVCAEKAEYGRDAIWLVASLALGAVGVVLIARLPSGDSGRAEIPGLEGVDVVEALFAQVERAERSEARVVELERQLAGQTRPARVRTLKR